MTLPKKIEIAQSAEFKPITARTRTGFVVANCCDINTMPLLPTRPAAEDKDIDENGVIKGLA